MLYAWGGGGGLIIIIFYSTLEIERIARVLGDFLP